MAESLVEQLNELGEGDKKDAPVHVMFVKVLNRAQRRRVAARLWRMGWQYSDIASFLGCCSNTVKNDIKVIKEHYLESATQDVKIWIADLLSRFDDLEAEANEEWLNSKGRVRRITTTRGSGDTLYQEVKEEVLAPNLQALTTSLAVLEKKMKLLKLDGETMEQIRAALMSSGISIENAYVGVSEAELDAIRGSLMGEAAEAAETGEGDGTDT